MDDDELEAGGVSFRLARNSGDNLFNTTSSSDGAGDVNGDGIDDLAIVSSGGDVYVVFGDPDGFEQTINLSELDGADGFAVKQTPNASPSEFDAVSATSAGDVNGDGVDDLVIGTTSSAHILFGRTDGFAAQEFTAGLLGDKGFTLEHSYGEGVLFGFSVSGGDVNGDGFADVVVGAPQGYPGGETTVFYGHRAFERVVRDGTDRDDVINGGYGADTIRGLTGDDTLIGWESDDHIAGHGGADVIDGGGGDDRIRGGRDDDILTGGQGDDDIDGADGADVIAGGFRHDLIAGGDGDDVIDGGGGHDEIDAGDGADTVEGGLGGDLILGGAGDDALNGANGHDDIDGGDGVDVITGGSGADLLAGGDGDDMIDGGVADDEIAGGAGDDELIGGGGGDKLHGGAGDDRLSGGFGDDWLIGGAGADILAFGVRGHRDVIGGFEDDVDSIELEEALWGGGLTAAQVVDQFATDVPATAPGDMRVSAVFDFGGGDMLRVNNIEKAVLINDIIFA